MQKKHPISYAATEAEMAMIERIMAYHHRATYTDAIRFLIKQETEKILPKDGAIA